MHALPTSSLPPRPARWVRIAAAAAVVAALAGCASGPREISTQVQSYSRITQAQVQLPSTYRLELLPSQSQQQGFAAIEAAADKALARVGLVRDMRPDMAPLVVQVGATASQGRAYHPAYDPWFHGPRWGWGLGYGGGHWGGGFGMSMMLDTPPVVQYRGVKLVIRDVRTQQIVYETSASYDEVNVNDQYIWNVLFDAALSEFPHPPEGSRVVRTTLIPPAPAAAPVPATTAPAAVPSPASTTAPASK